MRDYVNIYRYNISNVIANKKINIPVMIVESIDFEIVFLRVCI